MPWMLTRQSPVTDKHGIMHLVRHLSPLSDQQLRGDALLPVDMIRELGRPRRPKKRQHACLYTPHHG